MRLSSDCKVLRRGEVHLADRKLIIESALLAGGGFRVSSRYGSLAQIANDCISAMTRFSSPESPAGTRSM